VTAAAVGWIAVAAVFATLTYALGYLAGRESAESRAAATIADLRIALRRSTSRYLTDEPGRPE
jgi:hypothetical protein